MAALALRLAGLTGRVQTWIWLIGFLAAIAVHLAGTSMDFAAALRYPFELDYGEGIVWKQATMIPGPLMYSRSQELPFIVFHYPPLFYFFVRAVGWLQHDILTAGRLVSQVATVLLAPLTTGLVLVATGSADRSRSPMEYACAAGTGLLVLCLPMVQIWGVLMRVDMVAITLSTAALLVASHANGRFPGTMAALLLCVAAVFTKQTELPVGAAIAVVAILQRPRTALCAAGIALVVAVIALAIMQHETGGGFLINIVGYNVNRLALGHAYDVIHSQSGSVVMFTVIVASAVVVARRLLGSGLGLSAAAVLDRSWATRVRLLIALGGSTIMAVTIIKSGSSFNYLIEWFVIGCSLVGLLLIDLSRTGNDERLLRITFGTLAAGVFIFPLQYFSIDAMNAEIEVQSALVERIALATQPVASEDMTLLMRAGKDVMFEPAIVTELAFGGQWSEVPLIDMIRAKKFAFMITTDNLVGDTSHRSPAVDAAMRVAYPRVDQVSGRLWVNAPAVTAPPPTAP